MTQPGIKSQFIDNKILTFLIFFEEKYKGNIVDPHECIGQLYELLNNKQKADYKLGNQDDSHEILSRIFNILNLSCFYDNIYTGDIYNLCKNTQKYKLIEKNSPGDIILIEEEGRNIFPFIMFDENKHIATNKITKTETKSNILTIPIIQDGVNFNDHVSQYLEGSSLFTENIETKTPHIKPTTSTRTFIKPTKYTRYIIIQLGRFINEQKADGEYVTKKIITNPSSYNFEINIDEKIWELVSVIIHIGQTLNSGHYICYTKTQWLPEQQWYCLNDSQRTPVDITNDDELNREITKEGTPYIFLYKLKDHSQNILQIKKSMFE